MTSQNAGHQSDDRGQDQHADTSTRAGAWPQKNAGHLCVAISELALPGADLSDQIALAAELGWTQVGLLRRSLWKFGDERLRDLLTEQQIEASSLGWAGGFTGSAGYTFREAVEDGKAAIEEARALGARTLTIAPGTRGCHTFRHAERVIVDGVRYLADFASRRGIELALMTAPVRVAQQRWTSLDSIAAASDLVRQIASPWVGLAVTLDRWIEHPAELEALRAAAPQLKIVTSPLTARTTMHATTSPIKSEMQQLIANGFRGIWELDASAASKGTEGAAATICHAAALYTEVAQGALSVSGGRRGRW